jgi:DNA-binding transcriptional LysR family regulator
MPQVWAALRESATGVVSLQLVEQEPDLSVESLIRRDADIAIAHSYSLLPRSLPLRCDERRLLEDPVLLALPPALARAYELAPGQIADLAAFSRQPWLVPTADVSCHDMIERACGAAGFVPNTVAEATDFSVLTALVAAGAGVALVPAMALPDGLPDISLHPLARTVTRKVFALTRSGASRRPDIQRVLDQLTRVSAARGTQPAATV